MAPMHSAPFKSVRVSAALVLGLALGLVLYSYWFIDVLPASGRAILLATILVSLLGFASFNILLSRWVEPVLLMVANGSRWWIAIATILVGGYLSFAYLGRDAGERPRYIVFFLPQQSLRVSVPPRPKLDGGSIKIVRFTTSIGDVSYGDLQYEGWTRKGTDLVLTDPDNNRLEWIGRTGDTAVLTFGASVQPAMIQVDWNGRAQNIPLGIEGDGRHQYTQGFAVPFYATQTFLMMLGALDFIALCLAANLILWKNRTRIIDSLEGSLAVLFRSVPGDGREHPARSDHLSHSERAIIIGMMLLALLLRVFNLNNLYPYADEYAHLLAAKALLQGAAVNTVFERSLLITTVPMLISQRLLGVELWSARLPGVIFNSLAILPLYLLVRRVNRPVAVLASVLFAASPWVIAVSRNIREYAAYPFYFYWIAYAMVLLLERLPGHLILLKDWKKLFRPDTRWMTLILVLAPIYAVFIDARSTFKIIVIAYGVFALFLLRKLDLKSRTNLAALAILSAVTVFGGIAYAGLGHLSVPLNPHFNAEVLAYFLPNPVQQWYYNRVYVIVALAWVAAGWLCIRTFRTNFVPAFLAALFLSSLTFYVVFFGHYLRPRYLMIVQFWYITIMALGLYGLFALQLWLPRKDYVLPLLSTALFAFTFNVSQSFVPMFYDKQGNMPITEEYHFNIGPVYEYLRNKVSADDVLLSNFYGGYVKWRGTPIFKKLISYGFITPSVKYFWIFPYEAAVVSDVKPQDFILSVVNGDKTGWIVLDSVTYSASLTRPLPLKTTLAGDTEIDYVGYFGGEYVWRWHPTKQTP